MDKVLLKLDPVWKCLGRTWVITVASCRTQGIFDYLVVAKISDREQLEIFWGVSTLCRNKFPCMASLFPKFSLRGFIIPKISCDNCRKKNGKTLVERGRMTQVKPKTLKRSKPMPSCSRASFRPFQIGVTNSKILWPRARGGGGSHVGARPLVVNFYPEHAVPKFCLKKRTF